MPSAGAWVGAAAAEGAWAGAWIGAWGGARAGACAAKARSAEGGGRGCAVGGSWDQSLDVNRFQVKGCAVQSVHNNVSLPNSSAAHVGAAFCVCCDWVHTYFHHQSLFVIVHTAEPRAPSVLSEMKRTRRRKTGDTGDASAGYSEGKVCTGYTSQTSARE